MNGEAFDSPQQTQQPQESNLNKSQEAHPSIEEFASLMESSLLKLKSQFNDNSNLILKKMQDLSTRMDEMEKTISDMVNSTEVSMENQDESGNLNN